jgi:LDH2 family malate/lactate/ureidoglycolate dehydrogenase
MQTFRFQAAPLEDLSVRVFRALGAPEATARTVSSALIEANLMGHDSHGVMRIPEYVKRVKDGQVRPAAEPRIHAARGASAIVSGEWAFGQVAGAVAIDAAVERAREYGVGAVALVRCTHLGRVGAYPERAAASDCAAMVWVGGLGERPAVPHGGSRPALGTNPVSIGFPVEDDHPVVLDFATTAVAAGKVRVALDAHKALPPGCIVDSLGRPTTDPNEFMNGGGLMPFGGHKGFAMSVMAELFGQALTGADHPGGPDEEVFRRSGALFVAVYVGAFRPAEQAKRVAKTLVTRLRAVPPAQGVECVQTPGEPEARTRRQRTAGGIEVPEDTWRAIVKAAESVGLSRQDLPAPAASPR